MAVKIVVSPCWDPIRNFVESLPDTFNKGGCIIYDERNTIKTFDTPQRRVVVKSYRVPHFINRMVYGNLRPSKASRAFYNAGKMLEAGFDTPEPIAYIETATGGLFGRSYFLSTESSCQRDFREICDLPPTDETKPILVDFARFTAKLHDAAILHKDYTPGNIRFRRTEPGGRFRFELIDTNRMRFGSVSMDEGCRNMHALYITDEQFSLVAREYAFARGFDADDCERLILKYRKPKNR